MKRKIDKDKVFAAIWALALALGLFWFVVTISILKEEGERIEQIENLEELVEFYQIKSHNLQNELYELKKRDED